MPTFKPAPGVQLDQTRTNYYVHAGAPYAVGTAQVDLACDAQGAGAVPEPPGAGIWDPERRRVFAPEGRDLDVVMRLGLDRGLLSVPRRLTYTLDIGPAGAPVVIDEGDVEIERRALLGGSARPLLLFPALFVGPTFAANGLRITLATDRGSLSVAECAIRVRTLP